MYQLDAQAARESDNFGSYLSDTGKYIGKFTRAEKLISKNKGTHGIGLTFESDGKQTTRFDLWTLRPDNTQLMGFKSLQALMTVMSLRGIKPVAGTVARYNYDTRATDIVDAEVFPELIGVPVGLVLCNTEYQKMRDGVLSSDTGWRLELVVPFRAKDEFTASEILNKATAPAKLASVLSRLEDRPLKTRPSAPAPRGGDGYGQPPPNSPAMSGFDDGDDSDIPF